MIPSVVTNGAQGLLDHFLEIGVALKVVFLSALVAGASIRLVKRGSRKLI